VAAAAHVADHGAVGWGAVDGLESDDEIGGAEGVANPPASVAKNSKGGSGHRVLRNVRKKHVEFGQLAEFGPRMVLARQGSLLERDVVMLRQRLRSATTSSAAFDAPAKLCLVTSIDMCP